MSDNIQTTRSFQCREALWTCFEQMARELECSVDYLLNDAMKQYARQRGYNSTGLDSYGPGVDPSAMPPALHSSVPSHPAAAPVSLSGVPTNQLPPPGQSSPAFYGGNPQPTAHAHARAAAPLPAPTQPMRRPPPAPLPPPPAARAPQPAAAEAGYYAPPPAPTAPAPAADRAPVNIYYMGERYPVTKDRFIIGRGRQSSDLTIKDPNVSRQHAMIEYLNGYYYIVDMGSTNGVEYAGQRIQRRVVGEGDTFRVCDHELRFSFH